MLSQTIHQSTGQLNHLLSKMSRIKHYLHNIFFIFFMIGQLCFPRMIRHLIRSLSNCPWRELPSVFALQFWWKLMTIVHWLLDFRSTAWALPNPLIKYYYSINYLLYYSLQNYYITENHPVWRQKWKSSDTYEVAKNNQQVCWSTAPVFLEGLLG